jgi:hypothetical protein
MSRGSTEHFTAILEFGERRVQAGCACGWRSPVYGTDKRLHTMDARQLAVDAADLHEWDTSLP